MCKRYFASVVNVKTPQMQLIGCWIEVVARWISSNGRALIRFGAISSLIYYSMRRIYCYIPLSRAHDGEAPKGRFQNWGTAPQRVSQPASGSRHRSAVSGQSLLRFAGSSASSIRDASTPSHRGAICRRCSHSIRRVATNVLSRTGRLYRKRSCRATSAATRPEDPPQAFQGSPGACPNPAGRRPLPDDRAVCAGNSTAVRDSRPPPQSRACSARQKKTAASADIVSIPIGAAEDYEALRRQLLNVEAPSVLTHGVGILARCGLAVWARRKHELGPSPTIGSSPSASMLIVPSRHDEARSSLAKLIADLILTPYQETLSCRT